MAGLAQGLRSSRQPQLAIAGVAGGVVGDTRALTTHNVSAPITINVSDRMGMAEVEALLREILG